MRYVAFTEKDQSRQTNMRKLKKSLKIQRSCECKGTGDLSKKVKI
jgi:hypothetical protein